MDALSLFCTGNQGRSRWYFLLSSRLYWISHDGHSAERAMVFHMWALPPTSMEDAQFYSRSGWPITATGLYLSTFSNTETYHYAEMPTSQRVQIVPYSHTHHGILTIWWSPARATSINIMYFKQGKERAFTYTHTHTPQKQTTILLGKRMRSERDRPSYGANHIMSSMPFSGFIVALMLIMISGASIGKSMSQWQTLFLCASITPAHQRPSCKAANYPFVQVV